MPKQAGWGGMVDITCVFCGKAVTKQWKHTEVPKYCSRECSTSALKGKQRRPPEKRQCAWCNQDFMVLPSRSTRFCGRSCSAQWRVTLPETREAMSRGGKACWEKYQISGETHPIMQPEVFAQSSHRMKEHNPMRDPVIRAKARQTLLEMGHKPPIQGGNGRGMTEPERLVSSRTGLLPLTVTIPSELRVRYNTPNHYKIDLGDQNLKLAVEIDGESHNLAVRKEQDQRKTTVLSALGWIVLRFTNKKIRSNLDDVVVQIETTRSSMILK